MKTSIIVVVLLITSALAVTDKSKFRDQLSSLMNMQSRAIDAVDSALQLLRDLKQANVDAQDRADEVNKTQEAELGQAVADLTTIADQNKAVGDDSTEHRKKIESEIQVTQEYLVWITNRRKEINQRREDYREHRCIANLQFIKQLKEHDEGLAVIRWLKEDVIGLVHGESETSLAEIQKMDSAQKLKAYAHLFNKAAMDDFVQLTQGPEAVDESTGEWDAAADDNDKGALQLQRQGAGTKERDVGQKLIEAIERLEQHLIDSIAALEKSEIQAAWDLAQWIQDTNAELTHLEEEQQIKTTYIDRLLVAIVGAKAREDEAWEIYFESAATLNDAIADREAKRAWYAQEKARRDEENSVLDEVIRIFIERVQSLDAGIRNKVNDFSVDSVFQDSDIHRETDDDYARDNGRLQQNIEEEVGSF